jgi:hypothetical protein
VQINRFHQLLTRRAGLGWAMRGRVARAGYGKRIFFVVMFWACAVIPWFAVYAFVPKLFSALNLTGNPTAL